jgi:hypothetical protein
MTNAKAIAKTLTGRVGKGVRAGARVAGAAGRWALDQVPDILILGGATAVTYGTWTIARPAGWIVGGLLALGIGWRLGRAPEEKPRG